MEPYQDTVTAPSELPSTVHEPAPVPEPSADAHTSMIPAAARNLLHRFGRSSSIWIVTALLFVVSWVFQPASVGHSSLIGMLDFAAVLAIAAIGQTLVVQHRGIDLSVPGMISLTVVMVSTYPNGDSSKLGVALLLAYGVTLAAGLANGILVSWIG